VTIRKWLMLPALVICCSSFAQDTKQQQGEYVNNFETAKVGALPQDVMVLAGEFMIAQEADNKFLLLPGSPLESFGLLVGPEQASSCIARIRATKTGKRMPEFGVGLAGAAGYKLWLMPATNQLQIIKGEQRIAKVPYTWTSGSWTILRLQLRTSPGGKTRIEGKAWPQDQQEPRDWMISFEDTEQPGKGRASVWGTPYSDTPIAFDDIRVTTQPK
jgi:hypothetical protein